MANFPFSLIFPPSRSRLGAGARSYFIANFILDFSPLVLNLHRNVCSARISQTQPFMCTGRVLLESLGAQAVANAGTLLLTVQNVQLPYPLMVLYTLMTKLEILIVSAILRATVTTSTKERCAWDSGLVNAMGTVEAMTPTQDGILYPASS